MSSRPELKIDFCSYEAAKYAVEKWHYSRSMPTGKLVKFGVWENAEFVGAIIYGRGAAPNLLNQYGLTQMQGCELVRVAMTKHTVPVSRVLAITLRTMKRTQPGLRLVVSFADPDEGHVGGIYKASGWVYTGRMRPAKYFRILGKIVHPRSVGAKGVSQTINEVRRLLDPSAEEVWKDGKHRYLMPLDDKMRAAIEPLAQPYPTKGDHVTHAREA